MWTRVLFSLCCAAWLLFAQGPSGTVQNDDEPVYDLGPTVTPPRVTKQVNPRYSTDHGVRAVGTVTIALVVSSKGVPKDPRVVKGLEKAIDESAIEAVKQWRFSPAEKDGKAIAVRVSVEIEFHEM